MTTVHRFFCRMLTMPARPRLLAAALALAPLAPIAAQRAASSTSRLPVPADVLGFEPGADRHLPSWKQIVDYFTALDKASPRVSTRTLGKTVLGRPFIVAFISDSSTLANLERYRQIQRRLMDPRLRAANERDRLIAEGKNVILVTSSIHSTEVGGFTTPIVLADRLARAESPEAKTILANTIIMMVPSQNPDGVDIVGDYYRSTLGTPREGSGPPDLYHYYAGHDDNRDWYAFTQPETRYTVDSLYTPWDPQINNDIHQQGSNVSRIFIPPYMDPVEPNIDPILTQATNSLGFAMAWRMTADGFTGIASNAAYDQWSPARQYSLNHRGARILTETASARLASPMDISFASLSTTPYGYSAKTATWNFPSPWQGGQWTYGDIVRYQTAASWALFVQAAENRKAWLEAYANMGERALGKLPAWGMDTWPAAFVIPKTQPDSQALHRLVWTLQHGQVEVHETTAPATVDGKTYPAGSYVVPLKQPFGAYAKALLERQRYPDLYEYPGGPPKRPYDVTAHTIPLLFGVNVATVMGDAPSMKPELVPALKDPSYVSPLTNTTKRIAVYRSSTNESMDNGWTRWLFDVNKVPFKQINENDVAAGNLRSRFDAIIIPDGSAGITPGGGRGGRGGGRGGATAGDSASTVREGSPSAGISAIDDFVKNGGTVLAFNSSAAALTTALNLGVRNVLAGVPNTEFYCPGSILGVDVNKDSPIVRDFVAPTPGIWFESGPAFEITDPTTAMAVLTYPSSGNPLLSGWLLGGSRLNGKAALVDVKRGQGHVVLYGFRPQYRGQPNATFPLIWGAIR
jgi:hypothetical protein